MRRSHVPKEVRQAIIEMYEKGMSYRKISKIMTETAFKISHTTVSRILKPIRTKDAFERKVPQHKHIPLTMNIETKTLTKIRERMKRLHRRNESEMINETIEDWLKTNFKGKTKIDKFNRSHEILVAIGKRLKEVSNRRRRYKEPQKKTFLLNEDVLEDLRSIQKEISEYLEWKFSDYIVTPSDTKIPLDKVHQIWMSALDTESIDTKPIMVPLSQIVNTILNLELS